MRKSVIGIMLRLPGLALVVFAGCCGEQASKSALGWKAAAQASPAKKVGVLDQADQQSIRGWAWDPKHSDQPVKVDVYDGDRLIATLTADQYRTDLNDIGIGDGSHEFEMAPPAALSDGSAHAIHVKFAGTSYDLNSSPRTLINLEGPVGETPSPTPGILPTDRPKTESMQPPSSLR